MPGLFGKTFRVVYQIRCRGIRPSTLAKQTTQHWGHGVLACRIDQIDPLSLDDYSCLRGRLGGPPILIRLSRMERQLRRVAICNDRRSLPGVVRGQRSRAKGIGKARQGEGQSTHERRVSLALYLKIKLLRMLASKFEQPGAAAHPTRPGAPPLNSLTLLCPGMG